MPYLGINHSAGHIRKKPPYFLNRKPIPPDRLVYLYQIAEVHRILEELNCAKMRCQQAIKEFRTAEDAEELLYLAEARLVMGKILVDLSDFQQAISSLDKARTAFEICGEQALTEFQRLELQHKEQEANDFLQSDFDRRGLLRHR